jgi:phosphopantothenoylcysteine synthetase/decarboxylase
MKILVTAGNTVVPLDKVRCITNIFTGRTGAQIALESQRRGHRVTLLTSRPEAVAELSVRELPTERWQVCRFQTFEELQHLMTERIAREGPEALIHSAAVSDFSCAGIYAPAAGTRFRESGLSWQAEAPATPSLRDMSAAKVKSDVPELWLRLVRTPKLIDLVRSAWGFRGILVKFKLEVDVSEERLLDIAERSRCQSAADLMVANTLEGAGSWAYLGPVDGKYQRLARLDLARRLIDELERLHHE